jgi:hypothetical protein
VGYIIASGLNTFLRYLEKKCPEGPPFFLETVYGDTGKVKKDLLSGELDAAVLPLPCVTDLAGVEWGEFMRSGLYAIVHKNNALYERKSLTMAELKDQNFIMWSKKDMPFIYAEEVYACRKAGFTPRIVGEAEKMGDMMAQVAFYNGIGLTNLSTAMTYSGENHFIHRQPGTFWPALRLEGESRFSPTGVAEGSIGATGKSIKINYSLPRRNAELAFPAGIFLWYYFHIQVVCKITNSQKKGREL